MKIVCKRNIALGLTVILVLAIVLQVLLYASGCDRDNTGTRMKVAATIVPLADFCRNVGGELVEVEVMVPPGASPHTFEPTSEQMKFLSDAGVFVQNGLELEEWATEIMGKVENQDLVSVVAAENIPPADLIQLSGGQIYDPHVWLDPELAIHEVEAIRDGFIEADPDSEEEYRKNTRTYIDSLKELDMSLKQEISTFAKKKFVSFHPAFTYFAHRYGLEQVGVIEELPGKEPSAGEIAELVETIREQGVDVVFTEPQFNPQAAEAIASESGAGVSMKTLDPLGDPEDPLVDTYVKLMEHNTEVMAEVMR